MAEQLDVSSVQQSPSLFYAICKCSVIENAVFHFSLDAFSLSHEILSLVAAN